MCTKKMKMVLFGLVGVKVLNIGYRDRIGWGFLIDIGGDIGDMRACQTFIPNTIYNEILITKI